MCDDDDNNKGESKKRSCIHPPKHSNYCLHRAKACLSKAKVDLSKAKAGLGLVKDHGV